MSSVQWIKAFGVFVFVMGFAYALLARDAPTRTSIKAPKESLLLLGFALMLAAAVAEGGYGWAGACTGACALLAPNLAKLAREVAGLRPKKKFMASAYSVSPRMRRGLCCLLIGKKSTWRSASGYANG